MLPVKARDRPQAEAGIRGEYVARLQLLGPVGDAAAWLCFLLFIPHLDGGWKRN